MSTVLKPITCTQLLNHFYVYIYVPFFWAILDQIQYSLDFCHVTSFHGNKGSLNSKKKKYCDFTQHILCKIPSAITLMDEQLQGNHNILLIHISVQIPFTIELSSYNNYNQNNNQ